MRPPALTAQAIASLDQLSGGRLIVGVGRGFDLPESRREFAAAGADFDSRTRRMVDTISLWRDLWSETGTATIDAPYAQLTNEAILPPVAQPGGPPIWLAGLGRAACERVGALADGWLPYPPDAASYRSGWESIREAAATAGRDSATITPAMMVTVHIGAWESSTRALNEYVSEFYGYPLKTVSRIQACHAGSGDELLDYLSAFWYAGARTFILRVGSLRAPEHQLDVLADTVLPALAGI